MKTSNWYAVTTAAAVLASGLIISTAQAAERHDAAQRHPLGARMLERAREKLDLTDDQVRQIKSVVKGEKSNLTGLVSRLREARTDMRQAIQSPQANETSVRAAAAKVAAVEADVAVERMKMFRQISPILTEEQRAKFREMQSQLDGAIDRAIGHARGEAAE